MEIGCIRWRNARTTSTPLRASRSVFQSDLRGTLNGTCVNELNRKGVFAFSFVDDENQFDPALRKNLIAPNVRRYSKQP